MIKLYYTVEKHTEFFNEIEECTGTKTITTYTVENGEVKKFFDLELSNEDNSIDEINDWLIDNGYEEKNIDIVLL